MARPGKFAVAITGNTIALSFANGETRSIEVDPASDLFAQAAMFGFVSKLRDRVAETKEVADAVKAVDSLSEAWASGNWTVRSAEAKPTAGLLAQALANLGNKPLEEAVAFVATLDKKTQAAFRADPTVAAEIERIRPKDEEKKPTVDVSSALASFLS